MSVKKRKLLDAARFRKHTWAYQSHMIRCRNEKCLALNSPNAEICWRCRAPMKREERRRAHG